MSFTVSDKNLLDDGARFPDTRASAVLAARSDDAGTRARAFDRLVRAYWKPVYKHVRVKWRKPADEAQDLVQAFFARAFERRVFATFDADKAHFRTFLKVVLDRFVQKANRDARRLKRGGGAMKLSLDFDAAEEELKKLATPYEGIEATFDREWVRSVLALALDVMRARAKENGREKQLAVFEAFAFAEAGERPSYAALAERFGVKATDVTNWLSRMRGELRRAVLETLAELTSSQEELEIEARALLGDPR